jgi:RNA exonuclease 4
VCVVNSAGNVLLDEHVAQRERVTDYRTRFSGIRPSDLVGAPSLEDVQRRVAHMFKGRIVVGHAITNDLTVSSCESASIASAKIRRFGLPKNG